MLYWVVQLFSADGFEQGLKLVIMQSSRLELHRYPWHLEFQRIWTSSLQTLVVYLIHCPTVAALLSVSCWGLQWRMHVEAVLSSVLVYTVSVHIVLCLTWVSPFSLKILVPSTQSQMRSACCSCLVPIYLTTCNTSSMECQPLPGLHGHSELGRLCSKCNDSLSSLAGPKILFLFSFPLNSSTP